MSDLIVNHDEAKQLAEYKQDNSNLARCYLALRAQVEALTRERDEARFCYTGLRQQFDDNLEDLKAAESRADANAKDAERYQWLRNAVDTDGPHVYGPDDDCILEGEDCDAAVDAAIAEPGK